MYNDIPAVRGSNSRVILTPRLLPTTHSSPSRHFYHNLTPVPIYRPRRGWITWWACTHIIFAQGYCTIEPRGTRKKLTLGCRAQDQFSTSEPTAPYLKAREIYLWMCWVIGESNLRPFAQAASGLTTGPLRAGNDTFVFIYLFVGFSNPCYNNDNA